MAAFRTVRESQLLRRLRLLPLLAASGALSILVLARAVDAQAEAVVTLVPPRDSVEQGETFDFQVLIEGVSGLGAFQLIVNYDPAVVSFESVTEGDFIGSSGRQVNCLPPQAQPNALRFVCVTLGEEPPGPDGAGVLATVTMEALQEGDSGIELREVILTTIDAQELPATVEGDSVSIGGPRSSSNGDGGLNWMVVGIIIAAVAVVGAGAGLVGWRLTSNR